MDATGDQRTAHGGTLQVRVGHALMPGGENEAVRLRNIGAYILLIAVIVEPACLCTGVDLF